MKKTILFYIVFFCLVSSQAFAQRESSSNESGTWIKFAPFKLLGPEMKLSLSIEHRLKQPFSIQVQGDYIFDVWQTQDISIPTVYINKGYRIIPEFRYYTNNSDKKARYFGMNMMFKKLTKEYEEYRTKTDGAGQPFLQLTPIDITKKVLAIHILAGGMFYLEQSKRMAIDFNGGFGIRGREVRSSEPLIDNGNMLFNTNSNTNSLVIICNLKLCYNFFR